MQSLPLTLGPGSDLHQSLHALAQERQITGFVVGVVGNLTRAAFQCPGRPEPTERRIGSLRMRRSVSISCSESIRALEVMNCVGVPERGYDAAASKLQLPQQTVLRLPAEDGMGRHGTTRRHGGNADPGEGAGTTQPEIGQGRRHAREETFRC